MLAFFFFYHAHTHLVGHQTNSLPFSPGASTHAKGRAHKELHARPKWSDTHADTKNRPLPPPTSSHTDTPHEISLSSQRLCVLTKTLCTRVQKKKKKEKKNTLQICRVTAERFTRSKELLHRKILHVHSKGPVCEIWHFMIFVLEKPSHTAQTHTMKSDITHHSASLPTEQFLFVCNIHPAGDLAQIKTNEEEATVVHRQTGRGVSRKIPRTAV